MSSYRCVQRVGRAESQTPPPSVRSSGSSRLPLIHHAPLCSCVAELARSRIAKARGNHACQLVCRVSDAQGLCPMHNCAESLRQAAQRRSGRQAGRQCQRSRDCCALAGVSPEITVVARAFWRPLASAVGLFPKGPGWAIGKWQRAGRITASLLSFDLGMACPPAGRVGASRAYHSGGCGMVSLAVSVKGTRTWSRVPPDGCESITISPPR